jgi:hypothetical protein
MSRAPVEAPLERLESPSEALDDAALAQHAVLQHQVGYERLLAQQPGPAAVAWNKASLGTRYDLQ